MQIVQCELPKDRVAWEAFVRSSPSATPFHSWGWRRVTGDAYGHRSHYLMAVQNQHVSGILPLVLVKGPFFGTSLVSMPFADSGGICTDDQQVRRHLVEAATQLGRRLNVDYVEFRHQTFQDLPLPSNTDKVTMVLTLPPNEEKLWHQLPSERRSRIRKAMKDKLTGELAGVEGLDAFYDVFAEHMRDLGSPVHSREFFHTLLTVFPETARLVLVRLGETVIAAGLCVLFKDTLLLPWHSSLNAYRRLHPNILLYWEAMRYGLAHGARELDFGRSTKDSGTFEFKRNWGAVPRQLHWQYVLLNRREVPHLSADNPRYRALIAIWKKLPVFLSRKIGPVIRRSIAA